MKKAAEGNNQYTIKGQCLVQTKPDAKTCHKCGNPAHLIKDCDEKEQSLARKQNLAQFKKVYTRYRVPNYKKINRISYANRGSYYQEEKEIEEQAMYKKASQETNYTKEQGKGNFDNEAKSMYALLSAIKEDISSMKKEMNTINKRITKLKKIINKIKNQTRSMRSLTTKVKEFRKTVTRSMTRVLSQLTKEIEEVYQEISNNNSTVQEKDNH